MGDSCIFYDRVDFWCIVNSVSTKCYPKVIQKFSRLDNAFNEHTKIWLLSFFNLEMWVANTRHIWSSFISLHTTCPFSRSNKQKLFWILGNHKISLLLCKPYVKSTTSGNFIKKKYKFINLLYILNSTSRKSETCLKFINQHNKMLPLFRNLGTHFHKKKFESYLNFSAVTSPWHLKWKFS